MFLSFAFRAPGFELPFSFFLSKLGLPFHTPLIPADSAFTVLELSGQDNLNRNLREMAFKMRSLLRSIGASNSGLSHDIG
jgi:hypothetical protein